MMRGGQERVNWAMTLRYINECLPQPNGYNLPIRYVGDKIDPNCGYVKYWTDDAKRAADRLRERDQEGLKDEIDLNHLIQINLQSVFARYCDQPMLQSWFNGVKANAQEQDLLRASDWTKAPERPGWVLEVRGYTYHKGELRFIMETFAENLRTGKPRWDAATNKLVWEKGVVVPVNDPSGRWRKLDISHVAIYCYDSAKLTPADPSQGFKYIQGGLFLNSLVSGKAGGGAGMPMGGAGAGAGAGAGMAPMAGAPGGNAPGGPAGGGATRARGDWVGLGGALAAGGGGGGGMGVPPIPGASRGSGTLSDSKALKSGERLRTEFVILFYWHEPLPTEPEPTKGYEEANAGDEEGSFFGGGSGMSGAPPGYPGGPGGGRSDE
jgi:hypothetical protein